MKDNYNNENLIISVIIMSVFSYIPKVIAFFVNPILLPILCLLDLYYWKMECKIRELNVFSEKHTYLIISFYIIVYLLQYITTVYV